MILIIWRTLAGSATERREERLFSHKVGGAGLETGSGGNEQFEAMKLRICNRPCDEALQLREQSFLLAEAPKLPLPDCDRACMCGLEQVSDRRVANDRRHATADAIDFVDVMHPEDGRSGKDRRRRKKIVPYEGIC